MAWSLLLLASISLVTSGLQANRATAQEGPVPVDASQIQDVMNEEPEVEAVPDSAPSGIDLMTLITRGGALMIPIGMMSFLVVALAVERSLTLRRGKIIPRLLVQDLRELSTPIDQFDPSEAFHSCQDHPSPAARVVRSMLFRTGQPLSDIERTATETIEREADQFAAPIRWLTLAAAATPLMGLLGTVWGMIVAFHESTTLTPDRSRSEQLSEGIYTALVTTLAGLVVAIPAAILALYLENRLAKLFHQIEQVAFDIAPGLTRFVGRKRLDTEGVLHPITNSVLSENTPPPPPPPRSSKKKRGDTKAG